MNSSENVPEIDTPVSIAVIDDTEQNLYTMSQYLEKAGFDVWQGRSGAEAIKLAAMLPKLIILDVKLPDMIGYEVCRKIKSNPATGHIPVIHISAAYRGIQDRSEGLEGGADAYLTTPINPDELVSTVRALTANGDRSVENNNVAAQWRTNFDAINSGVCLINGNGIIEYCNTYLASLVGKSHQDIEGMEFSELTASGVISPLPYERMLETHQRETLERQSREHWWQMTVDPLFDDTGSWNGAVCILTDVSKRKNSEAQLRRNERLLTEFLENIPLALYWIDPQGIILRANEVVSDMFGYSPDDCIGKSISNFFIDPTKSEEILVQLAQGNTIYDHKMAIYCKDGSLKDVLLFSRGLWENGQLKHSHCFLRIPDDSEKQLSSESPT